PPPCSAAAWRRRSSSRRLMGQLDLKIVFTEIYRRASRPWQKSRQAECLSHRRRTLLNQRGGTGGSACLVTHEGLLPPLVVYRARSRTCSLLAAAATGRYRGECRISM